MLLDPARVNPVSLEHLHDLERDTPKAAVRDTKAARPEIRVQWSWGRLVDVTKYIRPTEQPLQLLSDLHDVVHHHSYVSAGE